MSRIKGWSSSIVVATFAIAALALADEGATAQHDVGATAQHDVAKNKEIVTTFYRTVFVDHAVEEGFSRYVGETYIQHNPLVPDGKEAAVGFFVPYFAANPGARSEIKRVIAEGDLVVLHVHAKQTPEDRGRAIVDIFRVEDGKIVEHWDVIQPVPAQAANNNTMF